MSSQTTPEFGKFRSLFWPINRHELRTFVPMFFIFFFISLNYSILRIAKDALVITAKSSGAEAIPFLKTWAILPMAILMTFIFTRLSNKYKTDKVFYLMIGVFLTYFLLFVFVIYPFHELLHPHGMADKLEKILPMGCHGFIAMFRNWTFTTFYVMAELWSTAIVTVLFWGFANEVTPVSAAKRYYPLLALAGNLSSITSGEISTAISHYGTSLVSLTGKAAWENSLILLAITVLISGLLIIGFFRLLTIRGLNQENFTFKKEISEVKMGVRKNFAYLLKSKYLLFIALIVITYNISMNLTEVVWKDQLHQLCPDPNEYQAYMGRVITWIGIVSTMIALFSGIIIRNFGWTMGALIPPLILLVTSIFFFSLIFFKDLGWSSITVLLGSNPLAYVVFIGGLQHCLCRASKYTLFDNTKELAFIPLSQESKLKGKAAIDGIGSRFGKSGGAIIYQFLLMFLGTISLTIPFVALAIFLVVIVWIYAVRSLGKQFDGLMEPQSN